MTAPAYRIETERLFLRCWEPTDAAGLRQAIDLSDAHLRPFIPFMAHEPRSLDETVKWLRTIRASFDSDQHYRYGIFDTAGVLLGEVMLLGRAGDGALELGYWLHVDHVGKGYAREATAALTQVAFRVHQVDRVELQCEPENVRSSVLAAHLGYSLEATLRRRATGGDAGPKDLEIWTLFAADFAKTVDLLPRQAKIEAFDCLGERII